MNTSERLRDQHYNHVFIEVSWLNSLPVSRISTWKCSSQTNSNYWAIFSLMQNKINSTSVRSTYWYPSIRDSSPSFHSQLHVQESCLLGGHFLKLSMLLFWVQKSLDHLTMRPLWQAAPYASKRWLTSWRGCGDNTAPLQGKQCSHWQHWVLTGRPEHFFSMQKLSTWNQNNCT